MTGIIGWIFTAIFAVAIVIALIRYFSEGKALNSGYIDDSYASIRRVIVTVVLAFIISRALMWLGGAVWAWRDGQLSYYASALGDHYTRWDANHYVGLIRNWYVSEGDPRFHIVFFPLYPLIGRALYLVTKIDPEVCGYIVSNICFLGCGFAMYELVRLSYGAKTGLRAVWLMMLSPLTVFNSLPYSESVFLLTTLLAVVFARKRKFILAVLFGALSANARMVGMATAIPIFYEMLISSKHTGARKYALAVIKVLPVSLGLIAYLILNKIVTGEFFTFMRYQSEHWSQNFGSLQNTVQYTLDNAISYANFNYRIGVWIPQIIAIALCLLLIWLVIRRANPGDMGYGLVYYYVSVAPTWLLSGTRYLSVMYPVYPFIAILTKRRAAFFAVIAIFAILSMLAGGMYSVMGAIL